MTSRTGTLVAPPAWGAKEEEEQAPSAAVTGAERSPVAGRASAAEGQLRALELRVREARGSAMGVALALGFALLWAFLLLGVAGPASAL